MSLKVKTAIQHYREYRKKLDRAEATFRNDWTLLNRFVDEIVSPDLYLDAIKKDMLYSFIYDGKTKSGRKPLAKETRRKYFKGLNAFFKWCIRKRYMTFNPLDDLEVPRVKPDERSKPHALTDEEISTICRMLPSEYVDVFQFFILTGRRSGEILPNNTDNCQPPVWVPQSRIIRFWLQKISQYSYTAVKDDILLRIVMKHQEENQIKFYDSNHVRITYKMFYEQLMCIRTLTGIPVTPHCCKDTYVSMAKKMGHSWERIAETLTERIDTLQRHYADFDNGYRYDVSVNVSYAGLTE